MIVTPKLYTQPWRLCPFERIGMKLFATPALISTTCVLQYCLQILRKIDKRIGTILLLLNEEHQDITKVPLCLELKSKANCEFITS